MPAVTRKGDADIPHCSAPFRKDHSPTVYANGIAVSRQTDHNTVHVLPGSPCPPHTAPITAGSSTVKVNNLGCGRVGDGITACTAVKAGSKNVFAGG